MSLPRRTSHRARVVAACLLASAVPVVAQSATPPTAHALANAVTGTVFRDFNSNGVLDSAVDMGKATDVGVAGIEVRAFDSSGVQVGTTTSGVNGAYTLNIAGAATSNVRIEFTIPSSMSQYQPSFATTTTGANSSTSGTSIQFATIGDTNINFAVAIPGEYCQNNPTLVTCAQIRGTGTSSTVGAFTFSSAISGFPSFTATSSQIGSSDNLGAIYGIGIDRQRNSYYGTYVKRHIEYGDAGATNTIYRINHNVPGTVTTFVTLPGTLPSHDPSVVLGIEYGGDKPVFTSVGRIGLGDVDVMSDGKTLLAVDMNEAAPKLYFVPINGAGNNVTAGAYSSIAIPKPQTYNSVPCPGNWHPMGIGTRGNRILVGGVCGAENTVTSSQPYGSDPTQSTAFVLEYTGSLTGTGLFTTIWAERLSYQRGCTYKEGTRIYCVDWQTGVNTMSSAQWGAWNEYPTLHAIDGPTGGLYATNAQAMLSNIEILDTGGLVIGYRDRYHDQMMTGGAAYSLAYDDSLPDPPLTYPRGAGGMAAGDIRRVCMTASGLVSESNGTCPAGDYPGSAINDPPTGEREYYTDAYVNWVDQGLNSPTNGTPNHSEVMNGSLSSMPGYSGVWSTAYDVNSLGSQGIYALGPPDAALTSTIRPVSGTNFGVQIGGLDFGNLNSFNKGNGLADMEIMCDQAPLQIGNRVWIDTDADGIQDPGETPVSGVTVRIYDTAGNLVSTAKTNSNGEYLFSSNVIEATNGGATPDAFGGNILPNTAYRITLDRSADFASGGVLNSYVLTRTDSTTAAPTDSDNSIDNDASLVGQGIYGSGRYPSISITGLEPGENNHTFDFGFVQPVAVGNKTWIDSDNDGVQDANEPPLQGVTVQLLNTDGTPARDANGDLVPVQTTDANGLYLFDNLLPGDYKIQFTPPPRYVFTSQASGTDRALDSNPDPSTGMTPVFSVVAAVTGNTITDTDPSTVAQFVNPTIDAGFDYLESVSVGSSVWFDRNNDGIQDVAETPLPGVTLSITTANGGPVYDIFGNLVTTTTTDSNGNYTFNDLPPGSYKVTPTPPAGMAATTVNQTTVNNATTLTSALLLADGASDDSLNFGFWIPPTSVGSRVWLDSNRDGIQDSSEQGIPGVTLSLTDLSGNPVIDIDGNSVAPVVTDALGDYRFSILPFGQYKVAVTYPPGYVPTPANAGPDSTVDSSTNTAQSTILNLNNLSDMSLDFGLIPVVSVGDFVWLDSDRDGLQDAGESGIANVELTITNADGTAVTDVFGNAVRTTRTDANGRYSFNNLPYGQYKVTVTPPSGLLPTVPNAGVDRGQDSSSQVATSVNLAAPGAQDLTLDFGFVTPVRPQSERPSSVLPAGTASPSTTVPLNIRTTTPETPLYFNPSSFINVTPNETIKDSLTVLYDADTNRWSNYVETPEGVWTVIRDNIRFVSSAKFRGITKIVVRVTDSAGGVHRGRLQAQVVSVLPQTGTQSLNYVWWSIFTMLTGALVLSTRRFRLR